MYGINAYLLRVLCEPEWKGGGGYTPRELSRWTPDQIYFRLCDITNLRHTQGDRTRSVKEGGTFNISADGMVKGRADDGTELNLPLNKNGMSLAAWLAQEQALQKKRNERRKKRGRRHGT